MAPVAGCIGYSLLAQAVKQRAGNAVALPSESLIAGGVTVKQVQQDSHMHRALGNKIPRLQEKENPVI